MRISSKGRYALAALTALARSTDNQYVTISKLSQQLDISKIYLEQVFSILKRNGLLLSGKGAQGGYRLRRAPEEIPILDILLPLESLLFEQPEPTAGQSAPEIELALSQLIYQPLDDAVRQILSRVTLSDLIWAADEKQKGGYMYYI